MRARPKHSDALVIRGVVKLIGIVSGYAIVPCYATVPSRA
jgi:hypothetical protein